jgi:cellulose biosynthesis protein BcsQ
VAVAPELVIPVRPNEIELRRIPATIAAAQEVQDLTGTEVYPRILLVAVDSRATDVDAAREFLDANNIPLMQKHVRQGVLYSRAFGHVPPSLGDYADVLDELEKEIGE